MFEHRLLSSLCLILTVTLLIFLAPWQLFLGICILLVYLAQIEFYRMMTQRGLEPLVFLGIVSGIAVQAAQFFAIGHPSLEKNIDLTSLTYFLILSGIFLGVLGRFGKISVLSSMASTWLGVFYVAWLFSYVIKIRYFPGVLGNWFLLFALLTTKSTDIAAYLIGSAFGKRKLIPMISPKKTVEGALGGIFGAGLAGSLFFWIWHQELSPFSWRDILFLSIVFGFLAQVGDIVESSMKRDAQIKDSGAVFPGMGGVLDVLDSLLLTCPLMYFYMALRLT